MACTIEPSTESAISLEEYIDFCESHPEMKEPDAAIEHAGKLGQLCHNPSFFTDYLNDGLKSLNQFQQKNDFKPPNFVLYYGSYFAIRAIVWLPMSELAADELLSYFDGHDHNFDLLTCSYFGSGYRTVIYQYDHNQVTGYIGEHVDLAFQEDTDFPHGKLMYYFSSRDVHTQYPPDELSISVNLIIPRPGEPKLQFFFDVEKQVITGYVNDLTMRNPVFKTVEAIGNDNSIDLLLRIASHHPCFRTRGLAWTTLFNMEGITDDFFNLAMQDSHSYVKQTVLDTIGSHKTAEPKGVYCL
ncbi:hypothetical protein [Endozoicomonas atrinae]|uniref:hypothetical protein n=1 Tax=Endozoicomonas atrinae TaxID=1333660 RepID=UPI0008266C8B|nr:hypothetical protein [Endozoicomonas atrinae]